MAKQTFEEKIKKIDEIITSLESNSLSLDESVKLYNEGMSLSKECEKELKEAALEVQKINMGEAEKEDE